MRIAFVTPRFTTEDNTGVSSYLSRMTRALHSRGYEVEVFVSSRHPSGLIDFHGIKVHRIRVAPRSLFHRLIRRAAITVGLNNIVRIFYRSWYLGCALEARERIEPFDAVQYTDLLAVGLFMRKKAGRPSIVRASTAPTLFYEANGIVGLTYRIQAWLMLYTLRRADRCYAPSQFVASYFRKTFSINMDVIAPPCSERYQVLSQPRIGLPPKYFIHFGQLNRRKGTYWLIESLKLALKSEPSIRIVMVGWDVRNDIEDRLLALGEHRANVQVFPHLPQGDLFDILSGAAAAILPSLVDNLPNAVIESLQHGIPVIGSKGASIDELVEEGITGELAEIEDTEQLSNLIVKFWRGNSPVKRGFQWSGLSDVLDEEKLLRKLFQPTLKAG